MRNGLPYGWVEVEIKQVCTLVNGRAFKPTDWTKEGLPIVRIQNLNNPNASFNHFDKSVDEKFLINDGDLLFAWSGTPGTSFGAHIWSRGKAILNQHIYHIHFNESLIDKHFLQYAINSRLDYLIGLAHGGAGLAHVTKPMFEATKIPLAPVLEQRRIMAKLEVLVSRVHAAQERLATIPRILKRFRQSVLAAACSGQLTTDWRQRELNGSSSFCFLKKVREERSRLLNGQGKKVSKPVESNVTLLGELPHDWSWASVDQLSTKVVDGIHKKPDYVDSGIPFLTVRNLTAGPGISFERTTFITPQDHFEFIKRANPEKGDILVTKDGTLGTVRLIETDRVFSIFVSLAMIKPVIRTLGPYLALVLAAPQVQQRIVKTGTGLQHIHLRDLRAVAVPVPPEEEQQEIVRRVEALFKTADALEARYLKAKAHVGKLTQSILAKAFRGELVPQDPNDEPASVLLERITAEQNGSAAVRRRSRK